MKASLIFASVVTCGLLLGSLSGASAATRTVSATFQQDGVDAAYPNAGALSRQADRDLNASCSRLGGSLVGSRWFALENNAGVRYITYYQQCQY